MFTLPELEAAADLVHAVFPPTPAYAWPLLAARAGAALWVKHENHTPVGAFKVRGGITYIDRLHRRRPNVPGIVSATRGNHGQSLAFAGARGGVAVTIVVPHGNSTEKNAAMRALLAKVGGARLIEQGADFDEARIHARHLAETEGLEFAPSFGPDLVTGVATWAWELFRTAPLLDLLYIPIGLGSSICGAIRTRDLMGLRTEIIGVQSAGAPAYALSFGQRRVVDINRADTHADGMATRQPDAEALAIILEGASRIVTVDDAEIAEAIRAYWTDTHNLAEGAGAAPLAAALKERDEIAGKRVGLVLSGGNIDLALFRSWVLAAP
jgi:threonine dehydratase